MAKTKNIPLIKAIEGIEAIEGWQDISSSEKQTRVLQEKIQSLKSQIAELNEKLAPLSPLPEMNIIIEKWQAIKEMSDGHEKKEQAAKLKRQVYNLLGEMKKSKTFKLLGNEGDFENFRSELERLELESMDDFIKQGLKNFSGIQKKLLKRKEQLTTAMQGKEAAIHYNLLNSKIEKFNRLCEKSTDSTEQNQVEVLALLKEIDFHARYLANIASPEYDAIRKWYKRSNIPLQFSRFLKKDGEEGEPAQSRREPKKIYVSHSPETNLALNSIKTFIKKLKAKKMIPLTEWQKAIISSGGVTVENAYAYLKTVEYTVYQILKALIEMTPSDHRRRDLHDLLNEANYIIYNIKDKFNLWDEDTQKTNIQARFDHFYHASADDKNAQEERTQLTRALAHKYTTHIDDNPMVFDERKLTIEYQKEKGTKTVVKTKHSIANLSEEEKKLQEDREVSYIEAEFLVRGWREEGALSKEGLKRKAKDLTGLYGDIKMIAKGNNITWLVVDDIATLEFILRVEKLGESSQAGPEVEPNQLNSVEELRFTPAGNYLATEYITLVDEDSRITAVEYFPEGHLRDVREIYDTKNTTNRQLQACHLIWQITDFCIKLLAEGRYYSDIKLTNFLLKITADGSYVVNTADIKSIETAIKNNSQKLLGRPGKVTKNYAPPEIFSSEEHPHDMDKFMAYLIGVALYDYLVCLDTKVRETESEFILYEADGDGEREIERIPKNSRVLDGCNPHERIYQMAIKNRNYKEKVFQGETGVQLRELCNGLLEPNPERRLSIQEASFRLQTLLPSPTLLSQIFTERKLGMQTVKKENKFLKFPFTLTSEQEQLFRLINELEGNIKQIPMNHDKIGNLMTRIAALKLSFYSLIQQEFGVLKTLHELIEELKTINPDMTDKIAKDPLYQEYERQYVKMLAPKGLRLKRAETIPSKPEETTLTQPRNKQGALYSSESSGSSANNIIAEEKKQLEKDKRGLLSQISLIQRALALIGTENRREKDVANITAEKFSASIDIIMYHLKRGDSDGNFHNQLLKLNKIIGEIKDFYSASDPQQIKSYIAGVENNFFYTYVIDANKRLLMSLNKLKMHLPIMDENDKNEREHEIHFSIDIIMRALKKGDSVMNFNDALLKLEETIAEIKEIYPRSYLKRIGLLIKQIEKNPLYMANHVTPSARDNGTAETGKEETSSQPAAESFGLAEDQGKKSPPTGGSEIIDHNLSFVAVPQPSTSLPPPPGLGWTAANQRVMPPPGLGGSASSAQALNQSQNQHALFAPSKGGTNNSGSKGVSDKGKWPGK